MEQEFIKMYPKKAKELGKVSKEEEKRAKLQEQLTSKYKVATPADWKRGEEVIIVPSVKDDEAKQLFPEGWKSIKPYLRKVPDPS